MRNYVMTGERLAVLAPYALASGDGFQVGDVFAVATGPAASGAMVQANMEGVHILPKATGAIAVWKKVYWDNTAKNVTTTAAGNLLIGHSTDAAASGDTTVSVNVTGQV